MDALHIRISRRECERDRVVGVNSITECDRMIGFCRNAFCVFTIVSP